MKKILFRALAEVMKVLASAILAAIGLSTSGCASLFIF